MTQISARPAKGRGIFDIVNEGSARFRESGDQGTIS